MLFWWSLVWQLQDKLYIFQANIREGLCQKSKFFSTKAAYMLPIREW